ncbi:hypothetical protein L1887_22663 [Cichorium endivia]|nr:hypothetical protein L1887_22663 [Cichorium endivia]
MGFDNECILNIQSLAGEYFCPVCRTLVYPHEAIQTQCTHLYCKPCLTYVVGSTQACPYDGYLVTEASSKPLMESNKALAETIGKTTVHCLYHRSGCVWQGPLSDCTSHCSGCAFGNSPVVCNRCGIQIVHRQVQEHAQTCNVNGTNTNTNTNNQPLGSETAQEAAVSTVDQSKVATQTAIPASQPLPPVTATGPSSIVQTPPINPVPQSAPANEQWYQQQQQQQQQYQQYYQQYPGYDPYQQQQPYQQYYPYQQPPPVQPQPQSQPQIPAPIQPQPPPQFQMHTQAQPQIPANVQPQPLYPQAAVVGSGQNQGQLNPQHVQIQPLAHGHMPPQSYAQVQPQMQVPQYQQQMHPPFQPQSQPMNPQLPPVQSVGGHPSYQPIQHAPPMQVHPPAGTLPPAQFPQPPPPHMRPTQPPPHMLPSQAPGIPPTQQYIHPHPQPGPPPHQRPVQQPQAFPGQPSGPFAQQVRPPQPMQQPPLGFVQPQQALPPQSYMGRPPMLNQGGQSQQFPQSSGAPPHSRPPQFIPTQPSNVNMPNQPQLNQYTPPLVDQKAEQQQDQSPSLKKPESVANEFGPNYNQVKPETGVNDDRKTGNVGEGEALTKDAVSDLHQVQDSVTTQRVKEETKDGASDYNKSEDATMESMKQEVDNDRTQIGDVSGGFPIKATEQSSHSEQVPNMHPGQQQRPAAPSLLPAHHNAGQPPNHGYLPPGPHPGDHFQPPGPNNFSNNSRGYEPQSAGSHGQYHQGQSHARPPRMSQGEPLGPPPLPYGPDGQTVPRHPGPMEADMYQNQRPSHFDTRRPDPHLHDRGPFGVESNSMRMNGAPPPPGHDPSSAPVFRDEKFRNPDSFPTRYHEGSPKFGSHSSRPLSGYGMDGPPPPRFVDKDPHGHGYHPFDAPPSGFLPPGRPLHDDNRGRFEHNRPNPDFHGPMHGFGRHHMDRSPGKRSFGGHVDDREMDRHSFGERFGPPGHMHRGEGSRLLIWPQVGSPTSGRARF